MMIEMTKSMTNANRLFFSPELFYLTQTFSTFFTDGNLCFSTSLFGRPFLGSRASRPPIDMFTNQAWKVLSMSDKNTHTKLWRFEKIHSKILKKKSWFSKWRDNSNFFFNEIADENSNLFCFELSRPINLGAKIQICILTVNLHDRPI